MITMKLLKVEVVIVISIGLSWATVHEVQMVNFEFVPSELTIQEGDTVKWINVSSTYHTSTSGSNCSPDGIWNSGFLAPGAEFLLPFDTSGTFLYFCIPHCGLGMIGTVTVIPSSNPGDINGDGIVNILDVQYLANYLYYSGPPPDPISRADMNSDGVVNDLDLVALSKLIFQG